MQCVGCRGEVEPAERMICKECKQYYHYQCLNITSANFRENSHRLKVNWVCPCCDNTTRRGRNDNTPVRKTQVTSPDESMTSYEPVGVAVQHSPDKYNEHVTVQRGSAPKGNIELSYSEDTFCMDGLRSVVREEMEKVISNRLTAIVAQLFEELATPMRKHITLLEDKLELLGNKINVLEKGFDEPIKAYKHGDTDHGMASKTEGVTATSAQPAPRSIDLVKAKVLPAKPASTQSMEGFVTDGEPSNNKPESEWIQAVKKGQRRSTRDAGVTRGAAAPGTTGLEAAERRRYLHLYYVKVGTTEEQVREHLNTICGDASCVVMALKARGNYASFKLDVPSKQADTIMLPGNWAEDICIRSWSQSPYGQSFRRKTAGSEEK